MDARFAAEGSTAERAKNAADARKTFTALFNADIEKLSPEHFHASSPAKRSPAIRSCARGRRSSAS
jgi:hypothetical protein